MSDLNLNDHNIGLSVIQLIEGNVTATSPQNKTTNGKITEKETYKADMTYGIDDVPPWYLCLFMALQHYLTMIGAIVSIPYILTPALCMQDDDPARSYIISTMIFVTGIVTFFQVTFGCRWNNIFLVPTLAILSLPQWKCPAADVINAMSPENKTELWQVRMRELSGAICVSSLVQVLIGYCGVMGLVLKFVTPLTIVPTVSLVGLSLFENAASAASQQWAISGGTIILLTVFSQILTEVKVPSIKYSRELGFHVIWFNLFKLFPVLLTIIIMWGICAILTWQDILPPGHAARTDVKLKILQDSSWFRIPYPGQWGMPTVSLSGVLGMLAGVLACTVESISYYPTVARMCGAPPPPVHAINRGIGTEGLGTFLAGIWGSGNGTNTFGENVGAIGVTKVGSRRVIQYACILMLLQGVINKFGAAFIIIPEPVVGGIFCVMFGMIAAFGLSALQYVELNSSRNLYIIGFSIFFSLVLSKWMVKNSGVIDTGSDIADSVITVLLSTSILLGGIIGCFLDNIIPGTPQERGLIEWAEQMKLVSDEKVSQEKDMYDFPIGMGLMRRYETVDLAYSMYEPPNRDSKTGDLGPPILIFHGLFGCKDNWRSISKQLAEKTNRKVFTLDARNHGESPHTKELSYNHMAADVVTFMRKHETEKATIIGHSMGGKTCMLLALLHPELIESLVIVDISPHGVSAGFEDMSKYAKLMLDVKFSSQEFNSLYQYRKEAERQLKGHIKEPAILQFLLTNFVEVERNGKPHYEWRMNLQSIYENFDHIGHFNCAEVGGKYEGRTIFIGGGKSDYIRKDSHDLIKQLFPKAEIKYIPGAGHWVHAEKPKDFVNMAGDFINNN